MSVNKYAGVCFICGKNVAPGKGDFQSTGSLSKEKRKKIVGRWLVRCFGCKGLGNKPMENSPFNKILNN